MDLGDVNLLGNGSAEATVKWATTAIVEVDIVDEALRERFKELFRGSMEKKGGDSRLRPIPRAVNGTDAIKEEFFVAYEDLHWL
jgi:hypothetical protein